jgi:hypothetical protein
MLSNAEFDACFDEARSEWFRLESHGSYTVDVEQPRFRAYVAGEPYDPEAEPKAWYAEIERRVSEGVAYRKVRVVDGPLSEYERWECEWSYTATEERGQRTFILDRSEAAAVPELPGYDWWLIDGRVVLRMHYDGSGGFIGAERLDNAGAVAEHSRWRDAALAAAVPFPDYWRAHPQYWRQHWLTAAQPRREDLRPHAR